MKIEMNKKYTSNRCKVRILCVDGYDSDYPVVVMYEDSSVKYFTENRINADDKQEMWDLVEVWEPQRGEWCLFWDNEKYKTAVLDKFVGMTECGTFKSDNYNAWKYCAKFDGTLPEHTREDVK
jgi:hypothetical protein